MSVNNSCLFIAFIYYSHFHYNSPINTSILLYCFQGPDVKILQLFPIFLITCVFDKNEISYNLGLCLPAGPQHWIDTKQFLHTCKETKWTLSATHYDCCAYDFHVEATHKSFQSFSSHQLWPLFTPQVHDICYSWTEAMFCILGLFMVSTLESVQWKPRSLGHSVMRG